MSDFRKVATNLVSQIIGHNPTYWNKHKTGITVKWIFTKPGHIEAVQQLLDGMDKGLKAKESTIGGIRIFFPNAIAWKAE